MDLIRKSNSFVIVYNDFLEGPIFRFEKGQNLKDEGISHQTKAIWAGYAEYPEC